MDPITQKIISLTITPDGESVSNVFQTYAWGRPDVASNGAAGIHTSLSTVDLTKGGMVMGKRWDTGSDWYVADTVISPLDGSQGTPGSGNKEWKSHPSATNGAEQDWTVPAGVTSVCIICVGGGAGADGGNSGGGGGLTWINDVPVTPGTILKVKQGKTGGRNGSGSPSGSDTDGQESYVKDASGNLIIQADGGRKNASDGGPGEGGTSSKVGSNYQSLTYGGGNGGAANQGNSGKGGGGGAGGYSGDGGNGGQSCSYGGPGSGGGAGGGGGHCSQDGGQGGGVDIYGQGSDGAGGADGNYASPGQGGSGGGAGAGTYGQWTEEKGKYGGGSGAGSGGAGRGAVRILWGAGRAFPSTNVQQDVSYTHAEYGSCNNNDKFHTNMEKGIKEWKETGWTWDQSDTDTQMNGDAHSANLAYLFRKCKRFFTIKEYTGNGSNQTLSHDLECEPSMIWVKNTEDDGHDWGVYHKQLDATNPESYQLFLSTSDERIASNDMWHNTKPTGSEFTVGNNAHSNASGKKYIAYLFAADQAAFGDSTVDVISKTGTYNGDSGGPTTITLGWEPQMVMIKCITSGTPRNWIIMDKIRLMSMNRSGSSGLDGFQYMNLNGSADNTNSFIDFTPEGFVLTGSSNNNNVTGQTYIYYAIRNDMISEPQSATEVYTSSLGTGNYPSFMNTGFAVDAAWIKNKNGSNDWNVGFRKSGEFDMKWNDKNTNEGSYSDFKWYNSDGWNWGAYGSNIQSWMFKRARGFFDLQYWDGDGTTPRQLPHQLGVTPEMMIVKSRNNILDGWYVYHKDIPSLSYLKVHSSDKEYSGANCWTSTAPTDTHFYLGSDNAVNNNASYHGQLFASLSGISKVGSYEVNANGDSVTVDCGFSAGPRFLLIKDYTNNSTDWMLFDTVRGMAEPHASLGEMVDDVEGQKTWTVPAGITSVSVLCIGGGGGCSLYPNGTTGASGGGGGALVYKNNISVTPGQTITYHVGGGGKGATTQNNSTPDDVVSGSNAGNGGTSWFNGTSDSDAVAKALGGAGASGYSGGPGGQLNPNSVGDGGGSGGNGGSNDGNTSYWAFGGGGGGYSGDGGNGGRWQAGGSYTPGASAGQGGGAGGGAMWANQCGTGIFGEGASGAIGQGGSGGHPSNVGGAGYYPNGGKYGGGGSSHGSNGSSPALRGAQGVVRVVWSTDGTTREFPTTNVQNTDQGYDPVLKLNTQDGSVTGTNYFAKTNSGFTVNANTLLSTPNAKYIFLAIA